MLTNTYFERGVEQIVDVVRRFAEALANAGIPYRVVGGLGVFLHIERVDPLLARLTRDVDVAVARTDLHRIRDAVAGSGFAYRHAAGVDMFVDAANPRARSAVHLVFVAFSPAMRTPDGITVAPVADLLRMKLTSFRLKDRVHVQDLSFRLKDRVHVQDLDRAGLIPPEIEALLSDQLRARLSEVRASE